ncbi:MAG: plasmid pRiA4b ORF-3 family protein [Gemmataceae bacterium]
MARSNPSHVYQLKITLAHISPPIWRRIQTPDCTFAKLHEIIQNCMGWEDGHLWAFAINGQEYGEDSGGYSDMLSPLRIGLSQLAAQGIKKFRYDYDFGDDWKHVVLIEKVLEPDPKVTYPRCVKGSRACPPEDCGGPYGYPHFLEAIQNPEHTEHEEMLEWIGGEFDPEKFDLEAVNRRLGRKH